MADPVRHASRAPVRADHDTRVQSEFTRQAESFAASRTLGAGDLVERLVDSLGDAGTGRVLDLAAGPGLVATALAPRAREVVALDLTAETLRVAGRRLADAGLSNVRRVQGDGLCLPFADADFDAAVIRLALHHLENPAAALREAGRAIRPGGRLAVLDLLAPEDPEEERLLTALERLRDPSHVRALREQAMVQEVSGAGFRIERRESFTLTRRFDEWAAIIADPTRTDALRLLMGELARRDIRAGIALREGDAGLEFDYRFGLVLGARA